MLTIPPLALQLALLPTKSIFDGYRAPIAVFDQSWGGAYQSLSPDQLVYCDLARKCQQRSYELIREQHALIVTCVNGRNSPSPMLFSVAPYTRPAGGFGCITMPPPFDKAPTSKSSKINSYSIGQDPSNHRWWSLFSCRRPRQMTTWRQAVVP